MRELSIGFVLPYGELSDSFFSDTLLAQLGASAHDHGHRAAMVRVYYDGHDPARDAEVGRRLEQWLDERAVDLVVVERLFDPAPVARFLARAAHRRCVLVALGDSFDPAAGLDLVIGAANGTTLRGTRRTPTVADVAQAFDRLVAALASGASPTSIAGVSEVRDGQLVEGPQLERAKPRRPYRALVEQEVIALDAPPRVRRKTLFGNAGCPFADDPTDNPHYAGVTFPTGLPLARLGCAFCALGGDYEKRPDGEVVADLVEQAIFWTRASSEVEELVLSDQHALRYLASLVRSAHAAGVRPVRWLFAARADSFVRERLRVEAAVAAAAEAGHTVEVYLTGFEAFSDAELGRYNKGCTVAEQLASVDAMRRLAAAHPRAFGYRRARGHSLILWNPWTTPADLATTVGNVRAHGLRDLFHELGKNRLRLYPDLPIFYAAERDGALADSWDEGDRGAGREKGYNSERPWRFLDGRSRLAFDLAQRLRERLGAESEVAQLAAVAAFSAAADDRLDVARAVATVTAGLTALDAALTRLLGPRPPGAPPRGANERGRVVLFGGVCNNNCGACSNRDHFLDDGESALWRRVDDARSGSGPVVLAGREPTLHPRFVDVVAHARGDDGRQVAVVGNGRRFAYTAFTRAAVKSGLRAASIKLFAPQAAVADGISADPGGYDQALAGLRELRAAGVAGLEIRVPLHAKNIDLLEEYVPVARARGAQLRIEVALDAIGLDRLADAARAVDRLSARCVDGNIALEAGPLAAGTTLFNVPLPGKPPV